MRTGCICQSHSWIALLTHLPSVRWRQNALFDRLQCWGQKEKVLEGRGSHCTVPLSNAKGREGTGLLDTVVCKMQKCWWKDTVLLDCLIHKVDVMWWQNLGHTTSTDRWIQNSEVLWEPRVLCLYKQLDAEVLGEGKLLYFYGLLDAEGDMMGEGQHCTTTPESVAKFCIYIAIHTK